jgi:FKBP-type peptidyl-prolyl cis-trans isomerase 2
MTKVFYRTPVNKRDMKKIISSAILIMVIFIGGCISDNGKEEPEVIVIEPGDIVAINYISWEKETGSLVEATIQGDTEITKETELDDTHEYTPQKVTVKAANPAPGTIRTLPGLEEALIGMEIGEEKTVEVPPEKGYGYPDENQVKRLERILEIPRYMDESIIVEIEYHVFEKIVQGEIRVGNTVEFLDWWDVEILSIEDSVVKIKHYPIMDKVVKTYYGPYRVIEITEEKIKLEFSLKEGEKFQAATFKAIVVEIKEESVVVKLDYYVGEGVRNTLPECEECFSFGKVTEVTDEYVEVDFNFPLKGKTVVFKVKVVSIEKVGR